MTESSHTQQLAKLLNDERREERQRQRKERIAGIQELRDWPQSVRIPWPPKPAGEGGN